MAAARPRRSVVGEIRWTTYPARLVSYGARVEQGPRRGWTSYRTVNHSIDPSSNTAEKVTAGGLAYVPINQRLSFPDPCRSSTGLSSREPFGRARR